MKKVSLRNVLLTVMSVVCIAAIFHSAAFAQAKFPTRPVTLWVGLPPGGSADVLARALAEGAEKRQVKSSGRKDI